VQVPCLDHSWAQNSSFVPGWQVGQFFVIDASVEKDNLDVEKASVVQLCVCVCFGKMSNRQLAYEFEFAPLDNGY